MPEVLSDVVVKSTDVEGVGIVVTKMRPQRCENLARLVMLISGRIPLKTFLDTIPHQCPLNEVETVELVHKFDIIMRRDLHLKPKRRALGYRMESVH